MKFLLLLVLVGCAAAYTSDGWERTLEAQVDALFEDDAFVRLYRADPTTEIGKKLQETLDHLLEQIKVAVEHGKTVKDDVILRLKDVRQKMKEMRIDMTDKAKELLKGIKDKAKDFLNNLLERIGLKDAKDAVRRASIFDKEEVELIRRAEGGNDVTTEVGKRLRDTLDNLLEKIKDAVDHGKTVKDDVIQKLKEVREKMKDMRIDMGEKAKELLKKIKDKAKDFLQNLLDRLGLKDNKDAVRRSEIFAREVDELIRRAEVDDVKTELGKKLREALDHIMEKIKQTLEQGKTVKQDVIDRLKDVREKLKDLKIDIGEKAKELLEKIKEKAKDYLRDLLDKLGLKDRRSVAYAENKIVGLFKKLKKAILDLIDKDALIAKIESFFGKGNELADELVNMLKEKGDKGKQKLLDLIEKILGEGEVRESRAIKDLWEKVKNFFKDLHIDLKEKYAKFGEWVKEKVSKGIDASKTKLENIKGIAREFVDKSKEVSKDVAAEALEFLKPYKEDLGNLWDQVKDTVKNVLNRKE